MKHPPPRQMKSASMRTLLWPVTAIFFNLFTSSHANQYMVLSIGGERSSSVLALDPETLKEQTLDINVQRYGHGSAYYRGLVIVCGGFDTAIGRITGSCNGYNTTVNQYTEDEDSLAQGGKFETPDEKRRRLGPRVDVTVARQSIELVEIPLPLQYFSLVLFQDEIYAIGGLWRDNSGQRIRSDKVYKFNLELQTEGNVTALSKGLNWTEMATLLTPRSSCNCQGIDDILFCFGGIEQSGERSASMDEYHYSNNVWIEGASMSFPRSSFSSAVYDKKIYATGGKNQDKDVEDSVDVFDVFENRWTILNRRLKHARYYHTTVVMNGILMVRGGTHSDSQRANVAQRTLEVLNLKEDAGRTTRENQFYVMSGFQSKVTHTSVLVPKAFVNIHSKLKDWPIYVGIALGGLVGLICLAFCCFCCCRYCGFCDCCYYYDDEDDEYDDDDGPIPYADYKP